MNNLIIIPALDPTDKLIKVVSELLKNNITNILVVDDGSSSVSIFNELENMGIKVIHHKINKGKGAAIKTALYESDKYFKNIKGFITADADGQHSPNDIIKLNKLLKGDIIFGVRNFNASNVPMRSRFGNKFSSLYLKLKTGVKLEDTQTGLRAFPIEFKELLLTIPGDRFDYEMNVLLALINEKINIITVPIETIYDDKKDTHFSTLRDSIRIYKEFFKYTAVSFSSALLDILLFALFYKISSHIILSTVLARVLSGIFNFSLNRSYIFGSYNGIFEEGFKYLLLFLVVMFSSALLVKMLAFLPINIYIIKVVVDAGLFIFSYYMQKKYIFNKKQ